eukprot:6319154-Pyramimonas_sp.AAC.1
MSRSRWGNPAGQDVGATARAAGAQYQTAGTTPRASSGAQPRSGGRQREAQLCRELLRLRPGTPRSLVELLERLPQGLWRPSLQELSRRWPQDQDVPHARGAGERDVKVQPPLLVRRARAASVLVSRAVDGGALAQRLALRQ